jgi:hypothetical protein
MKGETKMKSPWWVRALRVIGYVWCGLVLLAALLTALFANMPASVWITNTILFLIMMAPGLIAVRWANYLEKKWLRPKQP